MTQVLLIVSLLYLVWTAYWGYTAIEKLKTVDIGEAQRIHRYKVSAAWNGISGIFVFAMICLTTISLDDIGFRNVAIKLEGSSKYITIPVLLICSLLTAIFVYQMVVFVWSKKYQTAMKAQMESRESSGNLYDRVVNNLIPRSVREKKWFLVTSLAAGTCEEIVFRGFLLFLLGSVFPVISPYLLVIMIGVIFGFAHFYQGIQGVCKTACIGTLFGLLYLCTGSIYPCVLLHFLFDISSAFLYPSDHS